MKESTSVGRLVNLIIDIAACAGSILTFLGSSIQHDYGYDELLAS